MTSPGTQESTADACGCCGSPLRRASVSDCFDRGFRRRRLEPLPIRGATVHTEDGLSLSFSLAVEAGRIARVRFQASSCVTLVAYCELLSELVEGKPLGEAVRVSPRDLVACLPEVPVRKRDRAQRASLALLSAIRSAIADPPAVPRAGRP